LTAGSAPDLIIDKASELQENPVKPLAKAPRPVLAANKLEEYRAILSDADESKDAACLSADGSKECNSTKKLDTASQNLETASQNLDQPIEAQLAVDSAVLEREFETEAKKSQEMIQDSLTPSKKLFENYKIIGQVFNTYWIIEQNGSVFFIDQHAAHERILYERLLQRFKDGCPASQQLLAPTLVRLSPREMGIAEENAALFDGFGFALEKRGSFEIALLSVPCLLGNPQSADLFLEMLDMLGNMRDIPSAYNLKLDAVAAMACKAAVKANDRLSPVEAQALIEDMLRLDEPFACPHGRPTIVEMPKREWERKFKRVT
jgi:DNA mismatch repair protein MutL